MTLVLLCGACRADGRASDAGVGSDARTDASDRGESGAGGRGSVDAGADAAAAALGPIGTADPCTHPQGTFGSCRFAAGGCNEALTFFGTSATVICDEAVGDRPSTEPCWTFDMVGRCYDPLGEYFSYDYRGDVAEHAASCEAKGGRYCAGVPGVTDAHLAMCEAVCAVLPPHASEPECMDIGLSCTPSCADALILTSEACAECITDNVYWEPGGCNDWECYCPGPTFPAREAAACAEACAQ